MFDAYHKWLGIPPKYQPPNYYRLLGLELLEADRDVIANAADQRMMLVRSFQSGENQQYTQQLLNELATARVCLLSPQRKAEYDLQLKESECIPGEIGTKAPPRSGRPSSDRVSVAPQRITTKPQLKGRNRAITSGSSSWRLPAIAIAIATFALLCVGIVLWLSGSKPSPDTAARTHDSAKHLPSPPSPPIAKLPSQPITAPAPLTMRMVPPQKLQANETLRINIAADESSRPSESLRFTLAPEAPQGMLIDPANGLLTWTPSKQQAGKRHAIRVMAADGTRKAQTLFEVEVPDEPTEERKMRIRPIPEQTAAIGAKLQIQPELEPADALAPPIEYSLLRGPQGATVNPTSGEFTWQPDAESAGQRFEAKIKVADANGKQAEAEITIQVAQAVVNPKDPAPQGGKADSRLPVPGLTEQQKAIKNVRLLFADMYDKARTKREDRRILAEKLLLEADNTQDDVVGRYVLYLEGSEQAKNAEDVALFLKIVDTLATRYAVDATALKQTELIQLSKDITRNEDAAKELTSALLELVNERIIREEWKEATDILKAAQVSATKSRDPDLRRQVVLRGREVTVLTKAYSDHMDAQETLTRDADNPAANRVAGLYEALVRDDWQAGLPKLAKGDDESLASAARLELEKPKGGDDQKKVADQWVKVVKGKSGDLTVKKLLESSPTMRDHAIKHAVACYQLALAEATGLTKRAIEQQMSELQAVDQRDIGSAGSCKGGFSQIVDNPAATFVGPWSTHTGRSFGVDFRFNRGGSGSSTATYQFTGLLPGHYNVYASWEPLANRATNAPFTINSGGSKSVVIVNQQLTPSGDATADGRNFKLLTTTRVTGSTLSVTLNDNANGYVIADAVRIECKR